MFTADDIAIVMFGTPIPALPFAQGAIEPIGEIIVCGLN